jgi:hypothetical protein
MEVVSDSSELIEDVWRPAQKPGRDQHRCGSTASARTTKAMYSEQRIPSGTPGAGPQTAAEDVTLDRVGPEQEDLRNDRNLAQSADRRRAPLRLSGWHRDQHLTLDRAKRPRRTQGVKRDRMLFGWISTAA